MTKAWAEQFNTLLPPITEAQKQYHAKKSARYLFIDNKNGDCTCPKCGKELHLGRTKHKDMFICPSCSNKLQIQHTWRMSQYLETIEWMAIPKVVNNNVLCLRYVLAYQDRNKPMQVYEAARMFIDERHAEPEYYCLGTKGWGRGKVPYFRRDTFITPNRFWCAYASPYHRNFFKEIDKMNCFKYYSVKENYDDTRLVSQLLYQIRAAKINEMLSKTGMKAIVDEHLYYFVTHQDRIYPLNYKASSLKDILELDQPRFNLLRKYPSQQLMFWLRSHTDVNVKQLEEVDGNTSMYEHAKELVNKIGVSFTKANRFLAGVNYWEYTHYLSNLEKLGYDIKDKYYSLPKDFKAADDRITAEYNKKLDEEKIAKLSAKDVLIKKISDGLRQMSGLQEFLSGSNGLLVYIPESVRDLIEEGRNLHNCIGSYVDRISEGKTLVFFVRKLDNPDAPFVAFEYVNGEVVQCRYDHNEKVEDTEIINFVDAFSNVLRENKVLCA